MAKLPSIKRFVAEDFPSQKSWIGNFFQGLNTFLESVVGSLDGSLTVKDNLDAQLAEVSVTTNSTGGLTDNIVFKVTTKSRPTNVIIGKLSVITGSTPSASPFPIWEYVPASNSIKITSVLGLSLSSKYTLNLTIFTS